MSNTSDPKPGSSVPHFRQGGPFYVDITFAGPLPDGAVPSVSVGRDGGRAAFATTGVEASFPGRPIRMTGNVPPNAPPGEYAILAISVAFPTSRPGDAPYKSQQIDGFKGQVVLIVDPLEEPPPPPAIPPVIRIG
jgi:hypothetical protein